MNTIVSNVPRCVRYFNVRVLRDRGELLCVEFTGVDRCNNSNSSSNYNNNINNNKDNVYDAVVMTESLREFTYRVDQIKLGQLSFMLVTTECVYII